MSEKVIGLCQRCTEQIEWRKKYRKYKPLTTPATCRDCKEKTVVYAYHVLCEPCRKKKDVCAKCEKGEEIINEDEPSIGEQQRLEQHISEHLKLFRERTRRTIMRKIEKGEMEGLKAMFIRS